MVSIKAMKIKIGLFASLSKYRSHPLLSGEGAIALDEAISIAMLLKQLAIPEKEIRLIFVNGAHASLDTLVTDGDRVGLFPPIGGG